MNSKTLVEIARSFAYKHNLGNYQSADFFCSQKAEVPFDEAEETSEKLYQFCKSQVVKSLSDYIKTGIESSAPIPQSTQANPTYQAKETDSWRNPENVKAKYPKKLTEEEQTKPH